MPEIGELTEWLELQASTSANDSTGEPQETWETYRSCWGAVALGAQPSEPFVGAQREARLWIRFTIREPGIPVLPTHRILWRGAAYDLVGVFPEPTRTWLFLTALQPRVGAVANA